MRLHQKWVRFTDRDDRVHQLHILDAELQGDPAIPCGKLADHGLTVNPDQRRALVSYLSRAKTNRRATVPMHPDLRHALRSLLRISEPFGPVIRSARGGSLNSAANQLTTLIGRKELGFEGWAHRSFDA